MEPPIADAGRKERIAQHQRLEHVLLTPMNVQSLQVEYSGYWTPVSCCIA